MRKMQARMFYVCPTPLMTMKLSPGLPIYRFPIQYESTQGEYTRTMPLLSALFSGMSYKLTLSSNSSTAPRHKRVLIACLGASKMSEELLAAPCGKIIEVDNLSDFSRFQWLTVPSDKMPA